MKRKVKNAIVHFRLTHEERAWGQKRCKPGESLGEYARRRFLAGKKAVKR